MLQYDRLMEIAELVHKYFPGMETIGGFARVTDVTLKSDEELAALHGAGYDGLTIGIETADDEARATATVCNKLHPTIVGANMLTIYPDSRLYEEIRKGNWKEESETEKYREVRALVENLEISTAFAALGASNVFQIQGALPKDKGKLLAFLDDVIKNVGEDELRRYRESVHHL